MQLQDKKFIISRPLIFLKKNFLITFLFDQNYKVGTVIVFLKRAISYVLLMINQIKTEKRLIWIRIKPDNWIIFKKYYY